MFNIMLPLSIMEIPKINPCSGHFGLHLWCGFGIKSVKDKYCLNFMKPYQGSNSKMYIAGYQRQILNSYVDYFYNIDCHSVPR
jgi:hypothetical protein